LTSISKILVPVDFSSGSAAAVAYATALAKTLQSTVTLFHAYQQSDSMNSIVPGADNKVDDENNQALAQRFLERLRGEASKHTSVEMRVAVVHGSAAKEIISASRDGAFDLIVMGTHGRTGLQHVLMGSVAETVVRRASCPVLTIHLPVPDGAASR
jgi:nucleotide-binding universal stress UspA family protein